MMAWCILVGYAAKACKIGIHIKTDEFPEETGWKLTNMNTGEEVASVDPGTYTEPNTMTNTFRHNLPAGMYKLIVTDSYGDGSDGWFESSVDGVFSPQDTVAASQKTTYITCPDTGPPKTCELTVDVVPDQNPSDISWWLKNKNGSLLLSGDFSRQTVKGPMAKEGTSITVNHGQVYTFKISDAFGDGLCCDHGEGFYSVAVNGKEVASGDVFTFSKKHKILVDCGLGRGDGGVTSADIESGEYLLRLYGTNRCMKIRRYPIASDDAVVLVACNPSHTTQKFKIEKYKSQSGIYTITSSSYPKWHVVGKNVNPSASGSQGEVTLYKLASGTAVSDAQVWSIREVNDGTGTYALFNGRVCPSGICVLATNQDGKTSMLTPVVLRKEDTIGKVGGELRGLLMKHRG